MGNKRKFESLWLFLILIPIICLIQFSLLNIILKFGFTADDWLLLFDYKTIGLNNGLLLDKFLSIIYEKGIYTSYQVIYIGILESFFKGNYQAYQFTNILLKILATISLYPLVVVLFKRRLLALLTTILFAISYSSAGALQFVVKGSDYLAIFSMNLFLIAYYYSFKTKRKRVLVLSSVLLFLTFMFSPIRIYPLLPGVFLTEIIVWIKIKGLLGLIKAFLRLTIIFFLLTLLSILLSKSTGSYLNGPLVIYNLLSYGNYQLLLTPFAGLGYTFLPNDYNHIFGILKLDNFKDYLLFLLRGPIIIYSMVSVLIGFLIIRRTRARFIFVLGLILTNTVFEIMCYFLINNLRGITGSNIKSFYSVSTYAIFLGFYIMSVAVSSVILWVKNKSNVLFLSLFAGPVFASIFLWGTWFIIGDNLTFKEGIHWYLIIPPIGTSLFLASLFVIMFDRIKIIKHSHFRYIFITCLFLILTSIYLISSKEINKTFSYLLSIGYGASDQEEIKAKLISVTGKSNGVETALFYLDTSENNLIDPLFYPVTLISGFDKKMHFLNWEITNGCIGLILDKTTLEKSIFIEDGIKGFKVRSLCIEEKFFVSEYEIFYKPENFHALKFKGKDIINNTKSMLDELHY